MTQIQVISKYYYKHTPTHNFLEVQFTVEAEIMFTCPIDYSKFPFHTANCKLRLTSFSEFNSSMLYLVHPNETTPEIWWKDDKIRGYKAKSSYLKGEQVHTKLKDVGPEIDP